MLLLFKSTSFIMYPLTPPPRSQTLRLCELHDAMHVDCIPSICNNKLYFICSTLNSNEIQYTSFRSRKYSLMIVVAKIFAFFSIIHECTFDTDWTSPTRQKRRAMTHVDAQFHKILQMKFWNWFQRLFWGTCSDCCKYLRWQSRFRRDYIKKKKNKKTKSRRRNNEQIN